MCNEPKGRSTLIVKNARQARHFQAYEGAVNVAARVSGSSGLLSG
jgi:hypothetical protein